jgi:hypothetical protein
MGWALWRSLPISPVFADVPRGVPPTGNPPGRPQTVKVVSLRELCRTYTDVAVNTLAEIARDGESESARVSAANALLDRGWGRPLQQVGDGEGNALDWLAILAERKARV